MIGRNEVSAVYTQRVVAKDEVLLTPEIALIMRGLMRATPARMAHLSSVKKNQLVRYERGERHLSGRDRMWLSSVFKAAGAEIFMAQGHLQATYKGVDVIVNGKVSEAIQGLAKGHAFRVMRWDTGLSQRQMHRESGVRQHVISAIENNRSGKYHLDDLLRGNRFLKSRNRMRATV